MGDNRAFHYALLASVALHAVVLFAFPELADTARRAASIPPQIIARLMEPERPPAPVVQPEERKRAPPVPAKKESRKPPVVQAPSAPTPAPIVSAPASAPQPAPEPQSAPQPVPPVAAVEPRAAAPAPQPGAEVPETLSRDQYRVQLVDEARRHKRYPQLARENNWQGDVLVAVVVGANGRSAVSLKASSGYEVLDRQALDMFRQATRAVPVPQSLRGKEFSVELRAVFGLED